MMVFFGIVLILAVLAIYLLLTCRSKVCWLQSRDFSRPRLLVLFVKNPLAKIVGLLNHTSLAEHSGLLLYNCRSIHTEGMHMPIDVVGLDRNFHVREIHEAVPPGVKRIQFRRNVRHVLELAAYQAKIYLDVSTQLMVIAESSRD